ncbi:hypothetical protein B7P43_G09146 [Cryptotermes secundus]|uniref:BHLH domain-containing protein n=1 Tax=Cryptotermes secundus TaxID=105785 RepID=A0A2J7Q8R0_9NEOP|nr:hypothetical protein B7P43_G09146 [Cryptotermes secundus]
MPRRRRGAVSGSRGGSSPDLCDDEDGMCTREKPQQRNAANARERARMRVLSKAFCRLKTTLPWVPADTKLSKLDTLRLATSYIAHLRAILTDEVAEVAPIHPLNLRRGEVVGLIYADFITVLSGMNLERCSEFHFSLTDRNKSVGIGRGRLASSSRVKANMFRVRGSETGQDLVKSWGGGWMRLLLAAVRIWRKKTGPITITTITTIPRAS